MPAANIRIHASLAEVLTMSIHECFSSCCGLKQSLFGNSNNNEILIINLATVPAEKSLNAQPITNA
ncbi:MAG: hypothetical protein ABI237_18055 [Ginsengibacter sp.]